MARNILIFSDGTGQAGGLAFDERRSNIYKLYRATRVAPDSIVDPAEQAAFYDPGIGSAPLGAGTFSAIYRSARNFVSSATGLGLTTNIIDCYEAIIRLWRPGDRIFLFGFSRGAYTARCVGGVLALCGVPTQLENGGVMKRDAASARRLAKIAVKRVYQHTSPQTFETASDRQKRFLTQRKELATNYRTTFACSDAYPYFIGVFDTVASIANWGALAILSGISLLLIVVLSGLLYWATDALLVSIGIVVIPTLLAIVVGYLYSHVKIGRGLSTPWWKRFNFTEYKQSFYDTSLNPNVMYARHAISIDERRADFKRVNWSGPVGVDADGRNRFEQFWFAGNHSDVGGSYEEGESRLSDIALKWMSEEAARVPDGIKIDGSVLRLFPSSAGMQHDQVKAGFPIMTSWFKRTWKVAERHIPPDAPVHESVRERFKLPSVLQYDLNEAYRPRSLHKHNEFAPYYSKDGDKQA